MYAHQVIEDLGMCVKEGIENQGLNSSYFMWVVDNIMQSQRFHMEVDEGFYFSKKDEVMFNGANGGVRLPYKTTWVDYAYKENFCSQSEIEKYGLDSRKRGILAMEMNKKLFACHLFTHISSNIGTRWAPSPIVYFCSIDSNIDEHVDYIAEWLSFEVTEKERTDMANNNFGNMYATKLIKMDDDFFDAQNLIDAADLSQFNSFLKLLSCKNIEPIDNEPPAKLNKSRVKKGKQPLCTYKTLVIKPTSKRQQSLEAQGLWENRIHLCRGHFKEFSIEKPLFGKYSGRYWWQPAVRGRNREGVVMKDYDVRSS